MKDIGEFTLTINKLSTQFDEIKRRYDEHAGFKIGLQKNYSHFCSLSKIINQKICCESNDIEISTYPFFLSKEFARLIHVRDVMRVEHAGYQASTLICLITTQKYMLALFNLLENFTHFLVMLILFSKHQHLPE